MHLNEPKPEKKPRNAERPFPWRCRNCGQPEVVPTQVDYPDEVRYDGQLVSFVAHDIDIPTCQNCGEKLFTEEVDQQINDRLRTHLRLLTPQQMREGIEKLGLPLKEVADRLGVADDLLWRWVNDVVIQPRAMDNLLRLFFRFPEVRAALIAPPIDAAAMGGFDSPQVVE